MKIPVDVVAGIFMEANNKHFIIPRILVVFIAIAALVASKRLRLPSG